MGLLSTPHLSSIISQVFIKVAPTVCAWGQLLPAGWGDNATQLTKVIPGGNFLKEVNWVR